MIAGTQIVEDPAAFLAGAPGLLSGAVVAATGGSSLPRGLHRAQFSDRRLVLDGWELDCARCSVRSMITLPSPQERLERIRDDDSSRALHGEPYKIQRLQAASVQWSPFETPLAPFTRSSQLPCRLDEIAFASWRARLACARDGATGRRRSHDGVGLVGRACTRLSRDADQLLAQECGFREQLLPSSRQVSDQPAIRGNGRVASQTAALTFSAAADTAR
jgi:hypothetical protein